MRMTTVHLWKGWLGALSHTHTGPDSMPLLVLLLLLLLLLLVVN